MPEPATPRPMTSGVLLNAFRQVGTGAAGAATTIVVARALGPSGAGAFAVAQAALAVLIVVTTFGVENGVIFRVASRLWGAGDAFRETLRVALLAGSVGAIAGVGMRLLLPSAFAGLSVALTAVAVGALPFTLATIFATSCALAIDRYEVYSLFPTLQSALILLSACVGALAFGLNGAVVGMTLATVAVGCVSIAWGLRLPFEGQQARRRELWSAFKFGLASYGSNVLQVINYRLDLFILSVVTTSAAVGQYSIAVAASSVLWLLPRGLSDLLFPRVAQLSDPGDEEQRDIVEAKAFRHGSLVVVTTAVLLAVAVEIALVPIFGEAFQPSVNLTLILIPGAALAALARLLAASVIGRGNPIWSLYVALITTPLTVALYAFLIPRLNASGAALASTISYSMSFVLFAWYFRRCSGKPVLPLLIPTRSEIDDLRAIPRTVGIRLTRG